MREFISSRGIKFICGDYEDGTEVGCLRVATIGDLLEFAALVTEERALGGPQLVRDRPTLLLNGSSLQVDYDSTMPVGAIHYISRGIRRVLLEAGGEPSETTPRAGAPGGGAGGGSR